MKKVLIFTSQEGHLSIAQAIKESLEQAGFTNQVTNLLTPKAFKFYTPFYRYFPFLFKVPYKIGESDTIQKAVKMYIEKKLETEVKEEIKNYKPDIVISTNMFYYPAISKVLDYQKNSIPFLNTIADPWTIHPGMFSLKADLNLVYDAKGIKLGKKNKIPETKLKNIGWLVRQKFYQTYNLNQIRKSLGFSKNVFTILICGGSEGTNMILKIMPALLTLKKKIQVMVVCGTNKTLYKALVSFQKILPKLAKTKISSLENISFLLNLKIFRFTEKLPQLINIADLVIGKAGPNLIFETVACKKPFLAICHISGQEDGNLELIRKKRLGFVEENVIKVIRLLRKIIDHPEVLLRFNPNILKERAYNLEAEKRLITLVKNLTES